MSSRRVLYVETAASPGGSVFSLYYLLKGLDKEQFEPAVALHYQAAHIERLAELSIPIYVLETKNVAIARLIQQCRATLAQFSRPKWIKYLAALLYQAFEAVPAVVKLIALLRKDTIDLVHFNDQIRAHRLEILAAWLAGVPVVCHQRMAARFNFLDRLLAHLVKRILCISQYVQRTVVNNGIAEEKTLLVYNCLDFEEWAPSHPVDPIEESPGRIFRVGVVGRLARWKGQDCFIRAVALAISDIPHLEALVVGGLDVDDQGFEAELKELVLELGLDHQVLFTGFRSDVANLLDTLDVLVHSSIRPEPFGRTILEGMAKAKPVIASTIGGVPELIEDQISGLLVPPGNPQALAEALIYLWREESVRKNLGAAARERAKRMFNIQLHARKVMCVYRQVLNAGEA